MNSIINTTNASDKLDSWAFSDIGEVIDELVLSHIPEIRLIIKWLTMCLFHSVTILTATHIFLFEILHDITKVKSVFIFLSGVG